MGGRMTAEERMRWSEEMRDQQRVYRKEMAELRQRAEMAEREREEWRTKAMDVETHPVVVALRQEKERAAADNAALLKHLRRMVDAVGETDAFDGKYTEWAEATD